MTYDKNDFRDIIDMLERMPDPRCPRGVRYRFSHLLLVCIYAVLAGHSEAVEIAYYAELNFEYFRELLNMEGVPPHDTFSRVLRLTNFERLSVSLGEWLKESLPDIYERYQDKKVLHIDGKAARAASERSNGEKPIYLLRDNRQNWDYR